MRLYLKISYAYPFGYRYLVRFSCFFTENKENMIDYPYIFRFTNMQPAMKLFPQKQICIGLLLLLPFVAFADTLSSVTVQLKWKHQFQFAGFYAAIEKGYYKNIGLDVKLIEASPETNPITEVTSGKADYGVANSELLLHRLQGSPVTALAVIIQHSPLVLLTLKKSNILSPQDLINRRVMFPEGAYGASTLGIFMKEGIHFNQIKQIPLSFNLDDLITGKVDAMVGYVTDQPYQLIKRNIPFHIIDPRSYGIDFYGDTLFTSEKNISNNPGQVKKFREATLKGWKYAVENPEEISRLILTKYQSTRTYEQLMFEAKETINLIVPDLVEIGHMNPGRWRHIAKTFTDLGITNKEVSLDGFIYNPNSDPRLNAIVKNLWLAAFLFSFIIVVVFALACFNRRLKKAVQRQTSKLTASNHQLINQADALLHAQNELNNLNHELEKRVSERTNSLEIINQTLTNEIAERKEKEFSLKLLSNAVENSGSAIMIATNKGFIQYINPSFIAKTGYSLELMMDQSLSTFKTTSGTPVFPLDFFNRLGDAQIIEEIKFTKPSGDYFWAQVSASPVFDDDNHIAHYVFVCEDITHLKKRKEEMERLAFYDQLTGLENRLLFKLRLERAIAKTDQSHFAVLFIDVDHFKRINDDFGHDCGDSVLKIISGRLKQHIQSGDYFARISGDEFTILLNNIRHKDDIIQTIKNMLEDLKKPILFFGRELVASVSIGVTIAPTDGNDAKTLMKNADLAMYRAKRLGRNDYRFFSDEMNDELRQNIELEAQISRGIERKEFFLRFQPKICLKTQQLIGLEALVRWNHPERGEISPTEFINFAEESGLIVSLGKLIIQEAFTAGVILSEHGLSKIKIAINLSARQLYDPDLLSDISQSLTDLNISSQHFEFEVTESCLIDRAKTSIKLLSSLKEMGFTLSIDDFGTGYSSLSYLKQLPIDCIKIDKSFIDHIPNDNNDTEITTVVISMAHNLNLTVIAEGVETKEQESFLIENQCDYVQGFFYDKAISIDDILKKYSPASVS